MIVNMGTLHEPDNPASSCCRCTIPRISTEIKNISRARIGTSIGRKTTHVLASGAGVDPDHGLEK